MLWNSLGNSLEILWNSFGQFQKSLIKIGKNESLLALSLAPK